MTKFDNYVKTIIENAAIREGIFADFKRVHFPSKKQKEEKKRFTCQDCKRTDYPMYMANDNIWQKYGVGNDTLCLQCLNKRTGNRLRFQDFSDYMQYPVNHRSDIASELNMLPK